ncbi:MAG: ATP-binding protein, partial [Rikenellaceae bacterium]|nr:ATP-binding protein [Rikenellaceae bacterium]
MITNQQKDKILAVMAENRKNYVSDAKHAASLGITTSVYSAVKKGQTDRVLSDANWISIARKLGVNLRDEIEWKAAKTPVFQYVT